MYNRATGNLFERLPSHFRTRDAEEGRALQALMEIMAQELVILERDIDQLYDDWFVETCEPWALPYIAALIGARPMREIGSDQIGLLRGYVANVLRNRQAKGTAAAIEQVAREVSGWSVVAVEFFQRLATSQHMNHVRPAAPAFADLRNTARCRASRSPFSTMAHSPAAGQPGAYAGRYNIPHLGLFIWRRAAAPIWPVENPAAGYLGGAVPRPDAPDPGLLTFDPLGRDLPLVNRPAADLSVGARMTARTVPATLSRDEVFAALNAARADGATPGRWFEESPPFRVRLDGAEVSPEKLFCCNLEKAENGTWRRPAVAGTVMVDPELGRISLHASDEGKAVETGFATGQPFDIGGGAYDRRSSLEKWLPDLVVPGEAPPWQIGVTKVAGHVTDNPLQGGPVVASLRDAVDRWNAQATAGSRGIIAVMDNATYVEALNATHAITLPKGATLAIVAAAWPVVEEPGGVRRRFAGQLSPMHRRPLVLAPAMIEAADAGDDPAGSLVIDGLVITGNLTARPGGDLGALRLYNCTIGASGAALDYSVRATTENARMSLVLDRCIVGKVELPQATGAIEITRSIIGEDQTAGGGGAGAGALVLRVPLMDMSCSGSTVLGRTTCRSLQAENSILTGRITVEHRQSGCVRFCYVDETSVLPRRYRCVPRASDDPKPRPVFVSTRFQDPEFGLLSLRTPQAILEGAEDGMEMGVGYANRDPARRANIRDAIEEFAPFGLVPGFIYMS
jgi:hypothetical protein